MGYPECGHFTVDGKELEVLPLRQGKFSYLRFDHERSHNWSTPTKLQSLSNPSPAPLNSDSFAPFRLKVVSDAARSRRYRDYPISY